MPSICVLEGGGEIFLLISILPEGRSPATSDYIIRDQTLVDNIDKVRTCSELSSIVLELAV